MLEEAERRRAEEEARKLREAQERQRREEEEQQRRAEEEQRRKQEEEARRRAEDERRRRHDELRRREEEERLALEHEQRRRRQERDRLDSDDLPLLTPDGLSAPLEIASVAPEEIEYPALSANGGDAIVAEPTLPPPSAAQLQVQMEAEFRRREQELKDQMLADERRRQMEREAQQNLERLERENRARIAAEQREREDRERRERVEREQMEREEREARRREEAERKAQEEEALKQRVLEERRKDEQKRMEAERRKREDELARQRRAQEEADRKRAELAALRVGRSRSSLQRARPVLIGLMVVIGAALASVNFIPIDAYLPRIEKLASDHFKEQVKIRTMRFTLFPAVSLKMEGVTLGVAQDAKFDTVLVYPELSSLFDERKVIKRVVAANGTAVQEVVPRLATWIDSGAEDRQLRVGRLDLKNLKLEVQGLTLPSIDAEVVLNGQGRVVTAVLRTSDTKFEAVMTPRDDGVEVDINARTWIMPIGPNIEIFQLSAHAVAAKGRLSVSGIDALLYSGKVLGNLNASWANGWSVEGDFESQRVDTSKVIALMTEDARVFGQIDAKFHVAMSAATPDALPASTKMDGVFSVKKGDLSGVDMVRVLQGAREGSGSTRFEELVGAFTIGGGRYQYKNLKLQSGLLSAAGALDIGPGGETSGRVQIELKSRAAPQRANLGIAGTLKAITLR